MDTVVQVVMQMGVTSIPPAVLVQLDNQLYLARAVTVPMVVLAVLVDIQWALVVVTLAAVAVALAKDMVVVNSVGIVVAVVLADMQVKPSLRVVRLLQLTAMPL
jgi:hypothetical protein